MDTLVDLLKCERNLFLVVTIFGILSALGGGLFLWLGSQRSFGSTLVVLGLLEFGFMLPTYLHYPKKISAKAPAFTNQSSSHIAKEVEQTQRTLNTFLRLKLGYALAIVGLVLILSFFPGRPILFGICTALVIHLGLALTVDNFAEHFAHKYLLALNQLL